MDASKFFSLEDRTALVTGGSRGIGRMVAEGFVAQGARVYIVSRKAEACMATARELGPRCVPLPQDISTVAGCKALVERYSALEPSLDVLVNNAGAAWSAPFDQFPEGAWDKVMTLDVKAPFFLTQAFRPALKLAATQHRPAKVINITSIDGIWLNSWETYSYHAAKAGLIHLTRRMAATLIEDHIHVTGIAPGAFPSDMNRAARDHADEVGQRIPAGRVGEPRDIAAAAIYLASPAGDYVVGQTLVVDGGLVAAMPGISLGK